MTEGIIECKNCNTRFEGNYCFNCGQQADKERFTLKNISREFIHGFYHVNSGFGYTVKELFVHPGNMLRGYIAGKRVGYLNPFTYLVLISLVGGFLYARTGIMGHISELFPASGGTIDLTREHFNYRLLLTIPSYAVVCWILFRSFHLNLAEHLIINTFLISQSIIFFIVWMIVFNALKRFDHLFPFIYASAVISVIIYQGVVLFALFNSGNKALRWLKSLTAIILGLGLSIIFIHFLVSLIDIIK
jgi:hypothetical protein